MCLGIMSCNYRWWHVILMMTCDWICHVTGKGPCHWKISCDVRCYMTLTQNTMRLERCNVTEDGIWLGNVMRLEMIKCDFDSERCLVARMSCDWEETMRLGECHVIGEGVMWLLIREKTHITRTQSTWLTSYISDVEHNLTIHPLILLEVLISRMVQ